MTPPLPRTIGTIRAWKPVSRATTSRGGTVVENAREAPDVEHEDGSLPLGGGARLDELSAPAMTSATPADRKRRTSRPAASSRTAVKSVRLRPPDREPSGCR